MVYKDENTIHDVIYYVLKNAPNLNQKMVGSIALQLSDYVSRLHNSEILLPLLESEDATARFIGVFAASECYASELLNIKQSLELLVDDEFDEVRILALELAEKIKS